MASEMKAGRELDAVVAGRVMGLPRELISTAGPFEYDYGGGTVQVAEVERYSTDIAATMDVLYRFRDRIWHIQHFPEPAPVRFECVICVDGQGYAAGSWIGKGETAPLAICRAGLKAAQEPPK